jgi:hypothetical protein
MENLSSHTKRGISLSSMLAHTTHVPIVYGSASNLSLSGGSDEELRVVLLGRGRTRPIRLPGQLFAELQDGGYGLLYPK